MIRLIRPTSVMTTATAVAALCAGAGVANANGFSQTNLVSDMPGLATTTDSNLKNPWGVSFANGSPIWILGPGHTDEPAFFGDGHRRLWAPVHCQHPPRGSFRSDRAGRQRNGDGFRRRETGGMANPLRSSLPT
jgi:hypothetical protein